MLKIDELDDLSSSNYFNSYNNFGQKYQLDLLLDGMSYSKSNSNRYIYVDVYQDPIIRDIVLNENENKILIGVCCDHFIFKIFFFLSFKLIFI